jgi:hypothetical protein
VRNELEVPTGVLTVTGTVPVPAGDATVISVDESTFTFVAAVEPKSTDVAPERFEPVMVTGVSPEVEPEDGETEVTLGALGAVWCIVVRITTSVEVTPTAMQAFANTQETLLAESTPDGRVSCDQVTPFQERAAPAPVLVCPTTWQKVAEVQETPLGLIAADGRVSCDQVTPFQESA